MNENDKNTYIKDESKLDKSNTKSKIAAWFLNLRWKIMTHLSYSNPQDFKPSRVFLRILFAPIILLSGSKLAKNVNNTVDKGAEKIANKANDVTKFCLKLIIIVFIIFVLSIVLYSAWQALSITYNGEVIKSNEP